MRLTRTTSVSLLVIVALVGGCSSGSGDGAKQDRSVLGDIDAATTAMDSGKIAGRISVGGSPNDLRGQWQGATIASGTGADEIEVTPEAALKLRWTESKVYMARTGSLPATFVPVISTLVSSIEPPTWRSLPPSPISDAFVIPFSPTALVRYLLSAKARGRAEPGPKIAGNPTRHVRVIGQLGLLFAWSNPRVDLWTDDNDRIVRVRVGTEADGLQYDVSYRSVPPVRPPGSVAVPTTTPTSFEPVGPYETTALGQGDGITWRLLRAPGTVGRECWRIETTPPVVVRKPNGPDSARCAVPPAPDDDPENQVEFMVVTDGSTPQAVLAVRVPAGSTAEIGFLGATALVPMAVFGDAAVWAGPSEPAPGYVGLTLPDGTKLDCGLGGISTADDLIDETLAPNPYGIAWSCLVP